MTIAQFVIVKQDSTEGEFKHSRIFTKRKAAKFVKVANVAANDSREIARGLFLVLFSIRQRMKYNGILDLFNETIKYNGRIKLFFFSYFLLIVNKQGSKGEVISQICLEFHRTRTNSNL
jgi:hypothetical protein